MLQRIRAYVREHQMIEPGGRIVAGISGGPDSVCLLFLLKKLCGEMDADLYAVHVNHGLRGEESDGDEAFVRELCGREGIPWDLVFAPERMEEWLKRISKNILWGCFA